MLIVFEGIDGTGKGSQIDRAVEYLRNKLGSDQVVQTKEPGGTKLGAAIRRIMYEEVPTTELAEGVVDLLFLASHIQNWLTVVKPALAAGKTVVTDRWWYSQSAYATERSVPIPIADAYEYCRGYHADLCIFLHGDAKAMVDRARARTDETHQSAKAWNDYEKLEKIQKTYIEFFGDEPEFWPINVDGLDREQVWLKVKEALDDPSNS